MDELSELKKQIDECQAENSKLYSTVRFLSDYCFDDDIMKDCGVIVCREYDGWVHDHLVFKKLEYGYVKTARVDFSCSRLVSFNVDGNTATLRHKVMYIFDNSIHTTRFAIDWSNGTATVLTGTVKKEKGKKGND